MSPRAGLTTRAVVDMAARIADADGLDRLTLAGVAEALKVKPPSLYEHVDGLDGLQAALRLRGFEMMGLEFRRAASGRSRDEAVRALADAFRRFSREHPALYQSTVRSAEEDSPEGRAAAGEVLEVLRAVLRGYGIPSTGAVHATRYVRSLLHGFTSLEAAGGFGMPTALEGSYRRLVASLIATLNHWSRLAK